MRGRSTIEKLVIYVTFFMLSVALHVAVILGNRPLARSAAAAATSQASAK